MEETVRSGGNVSEVENRSRKSDTLSQNPILASLQRARPVHHVDFGIPDLPQFSAESDSNIPNVDVLRVADIGLLSLSESRVTVNDHDDYDDDAMASGRLASAEVNIELAANVGIFK